MKLSRILRNTCLLALVALAVAACTKDPGTDPDDSDDPKTTKKVDEWIRGILTEWYLWPADVKARTANYKLAYGDFFTSQLSTNKRDGRHTANEDYFYSYILRNPTATRAVGSSEYMQYGPGFEFRLVPKVSSKNTVYYQGEYYYPQNVYALVTYVLPGSAAYNAGLRRGDYIGAVNGTKMGFPGDYSGYELLLKEGSIDGQTPKTVTLTLYDLTDTGVEFDPQNYPGEHVYSDAVAGSQKTVAPSLYEDNPVYMAKVINSPGGERVAYVLFNAFEYGGTTHRYDNALKDSLARLRTEGFDHMVLDLRYNGGGYTTTMQLLGSMLGPAANLGKAFHRMTFNSQVVARYGAQEFDRTVPFLTVAQMRDTTDTQDDYGTGPGVNLNLGNIYVLVSDATASASEALVFCMRGAATPTTFTLIGTRTEGKTVGMHLVSPDYGYGGRIGGYDYEMWPVSFDIRDASGDYAGDSYPNGLTPDYAYNEFAYDELKSLGAPDEGMLAAALYKIDHGSFPPAARSTRVTAQGRSPMIPSISSTSFHRNNGLRLRVVKEE